ncbi:MAG: aromatic amino acid ammonia-lyase [Bacteroidales bacterium]|jgi:histidine ammonia-lyase|nr:aromatic amino acid ammonia-lyase [Bacteroidales bacterium]
MQENNWGDHTYIETFSDKFLEDILFKGRPLVITKTKMRNVEKNYEFLRSFSADKVIYGINTGFGPMAQYRISDEDLAELQYNIIHSHACGTGGPLPDIYVKAAMLCRCLTFLLGKSGVHPDTVQILAYFINNDIIPVVPRHGSVGASGDLVQLAHIALTLIAEGEVIYKGKKCPTVDAMLKEKISPLLLRLRDGLALCNGTSMMTGIAFVNLHYCDILQFWSIVTSLLINEIAGSYDDFLSPELNNSKVHPGQKYVAGTMREIAKGSKCLKNRQKELYKQKSNETYFKSRIQPYYSLRCVPQILGAAFDEMQFVRNIVQNEINSVDDNPIVDIESKNIYHGGNFHGEYVAFAMDKLKMAVCKTTMLAERQLNYLLHDRVNEILPPFVNLGKLGLNYGMQGAQFTATSTTAESQTLCYPMYIHSIPNNNDNQDIVSMGTNAALLAAKVIDNAFEVMAIYCIALAQAVDYLKIKNKLSVSSLYAYETVRSVMPAFKEDAPKYAYIEKVINEIKQSKNNFRQ